MERILVRNVLCITKLTNNKFQKIRLKLENLKAIHAYLKLFIQKATCSVVLFTWKEGNNWFQCLCISQIRLIKLMKYSSWQLSNGSGFRHLNGGLTLFIELWCACITSNLFCLLCPHMYTVWASMYCPQKETFYHLNIWEWDGWGCRFMCNQDNYTFWKKMQKLQKQRPFIISVQDPSCSSQKTSQ